MAWLRRAGCGLTGNAEEGRLDDSVRNPESSVRRESGGTEGLRSASVHLGSGGMRSGIGADPEGKLGKDDIAIRKLSLYSMIRRWT